MFLALGFVLRNAEFNLLNARRYSMRIAGEIRIAADAGQSIDEQRIIAAQHIQLMNQPGDELPLAAAQQSIKSSVARKNCPAASLSLTARI